MILLRCGGFAVNVLVYFRDYRKQTAVRFGEVINYPWQGLRYFFSFLGAPHAFGPLPMELAMAALVGAILVALFTLVFLYMLVYRREFDLVRQMAGWLVIGAYAMASAAATTLGRFGLGLESSLASKYTTFSIYLTIALIHLVPILLIHASERNPRLHHFESWLRRLCLLALVCLAALHLLVSVYAVRHGMASTRDDALRAKA